MIAARLARTIPDRWDLLALAAIPFGAVMLACVSVSAKALTESQPDVLLYFHDAGAFVAGQLPYAGFRFEYPPLGLVPMALPFLAWPAGTPTLLEYEWLFAFQNALLAALVGGLVAWLAARPGSIVSPYRALGAWALLAVVEAPVLAWRYDIAAVALAIGGLALLLAGRPTLAGASLALGALVKVFPAALLPVFLAWVIVRGERGAAIRLLAGFALVGAVVLGAVVLAVGADPVRQFLTYQEDRLVQIESVMSSALLLLHVVAGAGVSIGYGFQSVQITGLGTDQFLATQGPLMVAAIGLVAGLAFLRLRAERRATGSVAVPTLVAFATAALLAVLVTNKVFSAQYVLWLLPVGCLLPRRQVAVLIGVAILSIVVFPLSYAELMNLEIPAILTLVVRNGLLIGLLGWVLVRYRPSAVRTGAIAVPVGGSGGPTRSIALPVAATAEPEGSATPRSRAAPPRRVITGSRPGSGASADAYEPTPRTS